MASVWHPLRKILRQDVRAIQFSAEDGWVHDLSAVSGPIKYWLEVGGVAVMMDQAARDIVDAQEAAEVLEADKTDNKARIDDERIIKALALVTMDEINILRTLHGIPNRTASQLINAIKAKVDLI